MTTIGFIGAGLIGGTVARLAVAAGYDVVLSNSRGPATLADLVDDLGPRARAALPAQAAEAGDLVVVTIPLRAYRSVPVAPLDGKVVIDTNNYYPGRDGHFRELDNGSTTSSELLQEHLPRSRVVKCFNNIVWWHLRVLARPSGSADRSALPIAGNDTAAKAMVTGFLDRIGYDAVDLGSLAEGRRFQPGTALYAQIYGGGRADYFDAPPKPLSAEEIRRAVTAALR
ncbi:NADPH-dependent F420 reductase [Nocardia sp. CDC159]|uniref:NADPH-dependent F420 reductase n=1 Tax=Nocardia pulmonis TaxID=2951408 RepID=A0A9X2E863_9NOCA|nr:MULTISPECIES: NADPH-dependent F420 reductase [Nocardia]MCM6775355.1 NADPH-dependent F420 reductase [Nocardia pulmonis]MCM6787911.1 NADPH-dependent F420 reductase [Nocardia sp. CDC159]